MLSEQFQVTCDYAQPRIKRHNKSALASGEEWDVGQDVWKDPVTKTIMLRPMSRYRTEWGTTNSGIYTKPPIGSYLFKTPSNWREHIVNSGAGGFMQTDTSGEWVKTLSAPGKNRGVNLSFFKYGSGDSRVIAEFGWHDTNLTAETATVGVKFYSTGEFHVYKNGVRVASESLSFSSTNEDNSQIEFLMLPCRHRELLVVASTGSGFSVLFDDIAENDVDPEIVPASKFFFVPEATSTSAQVQITPVLYVGSGYVLTKKVTFARPPETGDTLTVWQNQVFTSITTANVYGHKAGAGTTDVTLVGFYETDGTTPFVPDGIKTEAKVRLDMTGSTGYSPFVYSAFLTFNSEIQTTNDTEESELLDFIDDLTVVIPDDPFGVVVSVLLRDPTGLAAQTPKIDVIPNRPMKLSLGTIDLINGVSSPSKIKLEAEASCSTLELSFGDYSQLMEQYIFRDPMPLDGLLLSHPSNPCIVRYFLELVGLGSIDMDLEDAGFRLPSVPGKENKDYSFQVSAGETMLDALRKLHEQFFASAIMGFVPTETGIKFVFRDEAAYELTSKRKLYTSKASAVADLIPEEEAKYHVITSLTTELLGIDANELTVIGVDRRTNEPFQVFIDNLASQDATLAPSARPDDSRMNVIAFSVADDQIRDVATAQRVLDFLVPIVMSPRVIYQFETISLLTHEPTPGVEVPIWRGDMVELEGIGDVRISSIDFEVVRSSVDTKVVKTIYTAGAFVNAGGTSISTIQANARAKYSGNSRTFGTRRIFAVQKFSRTK